MNAFVGRRQSGVQLERGWAEGAVCSGMGKRLGIIKATRAVSREAYLRYAIGGERINEVLPK